MLYHAWFFLGQTWDSADIGGEVEWISRAAGCCEILLTINSGRDLDVVSM